jgi:hypothetical protein
VEHQGADAEIVFWGRAGRAAFDHGLTGYALEGRHRALDCPACHQPKYRSRAHPLAAAARTFLGLERPCRACHADAHAGEFGGRECASCHTLDAFRPAPRFDHGRSAYPLTGRHEAVACTKCHPAAGGAAGGRPASSRRFKGLSFKECSDCHPDAHRGRFGAACANCHDTRGWRGARRAGFDHARTAFPLRDRHAQVACDRCHTPGRPLRLPFARCADCHADSHQGQFARRADRGRCEACHDEKGFSPARYALDEHQQSGYPLEGAHLAVACNACHRPGSEPGPGLAVRRAPTRSPAPFRFASKRCHDCHRDPHRGEVAGHVKAGGCEACHTVESWRAASFDHDRTRFALAGGHARAPCAACHRGKGEAAGALRLAGLPTTCAGCHQDPHQGQFAREGRPAPCERCHTGQDLGASRFAHAKTAWPLDGAHARLPCAACHRLETRAGVAYVRYRPLPTTCRGCHTDASAPQPQKKS